MFWVIQENFMKDEGQYQLMLNTLERLEIPHQIVKYVPIGCFLEPDVNPEGKVWVMGGVSMDRICQAKGWLPGYSKENLEYDKLLKNYGDLMLNSDAVVGKILEVSPPWPFFFIRPCNDRKSFSGQTMTQEGLKVWQEKLAKDGAEESSKQSVQPNSVVVCASEKEIRCEWRFFVVNNQPITASLYKRGGEVRYDALVDERVWDFVREVIEVWAPNPAFVLDVCETADGQMKVMEINSLNSAGFYACQIDRVVVALEELFNVG